MKTTLIEKGLIGAIVGGLTIGAYFLGKYNNNFNDNFYLHETSPIHTMPCSIRNNKGEKVSRNFVDNTLFYETGHITIRRGLNLVLNSDLTLNENFREIEGIRQENNDILTSNGIIFSYVDTYNCPRYELK